MRKRMLVGVSVGAAIVMTSGAAADGDYCTEFISGGPENPVICTLVKEYPTGDGEYWCEGEGEPTGEVWCNCQGDSSPFPACDDLLGAN